MVMMTTTPMATTLPHFAALEFSFPGEPRTTKTRVLGSERMTVIMYSQNVMPVHENRGFARSKNLRLMRWKKRGESRLTGWNNTVADNQNASEASFLGNSRCSRPFDLFSDFLIDPPGKSIFENNTAFSQKHASLINLEEQNPQARRFPQNSPQTSNANPNAKWISQLSQSQ